MTNPNCKKCIIYAESLELIASKYSLLYTFSIIFSISLSVILLTKLVKNESWIIVLGLLSVIFAIIPLVFKDKIEKVHGYNSLAKEFETLELDFRNMGNTRLNLSRLVDLTLEASDYPIDRYTKWRIKK